MKMETIMKTTNCSSPPPNTGRNFPTPSWFRPVVRWCAGFALNAPTWMPLPIRNAPLRMSSVLLRFYFRAIR
jgi:hypothetical protein